VAETLGTVAGQTPESLDQRRILRVLRSTDCNIAESARELYVHPNTLRSRIARIEQITGPFMNEPERRLTIFTALSMFSLDNNVEGE
jgi:DNA-binding PucR family transcriptional regulator